LHAFGGGELLKGKWNTNKTDRRKQREVATVINAEGGISRKKAKAPRSWKKRALRDQGGRNPLRDPPRREGGNSSAPQAQNAKLDLLLLFKREEKETLAVKVEKRSR